MVGGHRHGHRPRGEHIFERFDRADDARTAEEGGAGLGLAIAREIARAHGGDIYAASAQGVTSFTVWIPQGPATPTAG